MKKMKLILSAVLFSMAASCFGTTIVQTYATMVAFPTPVAGQQFYVSTPGTYYYYSGTAYTQYLASATGGFGPVSIVNIAPSATPTPVAVQLLGTQVPISVQNNAPASTQTPIIVVFPYTATPTFTPTSTPAVITKLISNTTPVVISPSWSGHLVLLGSSMTNAATFTGPVSIYDGATTFFSHTMGGNEWGIVEGTPRNQATANTPVSLYDPNAVSVEGTWIWGFLP